MKASYFSSTTKLRSPGATASGAIVWDEIMSSNRFSRALRRAQRARCKASIVRRVRTTPWFSYYLEDPTLMAHYVGISLSTRARCSCWMCCNPRRRLKNSAGAKTFQEIRQNARLLDWVDTDVPNNLLT
jgi:hypothetical protein